MCDVISVAMALLDTYYISDELVPAGFERKVGEGLLSTSLFSPQVLDASTESVKGGKV